jgi:hypothetical protein
MNTHHRFLAAAAFLLGACSGGGGGAGSGGGSSTLRLSATDAPFVHDLVDEATISVDRITIHHDADSENAPVVLYEGAPIEMVLTDLRDGVSQFLGEHELDYGRACPAKPRHCAPR